MWHGAPTRHQKQAGVRALCLQKRKLCAAALSPGGFKEPGFRPKRRAPTKKTDYLRNKKFSQRFHACNHVFHTRLDDNLTRARVGCYRKCFDPLNVCQRHPVLMENGAKNRVFLGVHLFTPRRRACAPHSCAFLRVCLGCYKTCAPREFARASVVVKFNHFDREL